MPIPLMYGEHRVFWILRRYYRYHLVMPSVPRRSPSTQDMVGGDNNRTPVIFQAPDIYRFVGGIRKFENAFRCRYHQISVSSQLSAKPQYMAETIKRIFVLEFSQLFLILFHPSISTAFPEDVDGLSELRLGSFNISLPLEPVGI